MSNEYGYINLLKEIVDHGIHKENRTDVDTISVFSPDILRFDLRNQNIPLFTTRNLGYKWIIKELLWFIRGETDNKILTDQGVKIWIPNTTKEFMDKYKLPLEENDIGALYGFSIRHWGADYVDCKTDYTGQGFDQLLYVEKLIKNDPNSRRIIINNWNPSYFGKQVLTPCHMSIIFNVTNGYLNGLLTVRSSDTCLGLPSNVFSYSVLIYILALRCDLIPGRLNVSLGDAHIYISHLTGIREILNREPYEAPKFYINSEVKYKRWEDITIDDFKVIGYRSHPKISFDMVA